MNERAPDPLGYTKGVERLHSRDMCTRGEVPLRPGRGDRRGGAGTWRMSPPRVRQANAHQTASNRYGQAKREIQHEDPFFGFSALQDLSTAFSSMKLQSYKSYSQLVAGIKKR